MVATENDSFELWTPNQIVAYNFRLLREKIGWNQRKAAAALSGYLDTPWSQATFSAAERSIDERNGRKFNFEELLASCLTFAVPIFRFLLPPEGRGVQVGLGSEVIEMHGLLKAVFAGATEKDIAEREREAFDLGFKAGAYHAKYGSNILSAFHDPSSKSRSEPPKPELPEVPRPPSPRKFKIEDHV